MAGKRFPISDNATDFTVQMVIFTANLPRFRPIRRYPEIRAHRQTRQETFPYGRETLHRAVKRFHDITDRFRISENATDSQSLMVIYLLRNAHPNLSLRGLIPRSGRIGRHTRKTFPSGRETLHMYGKRFSDSGKRCADFGNLTEFATRRIIAKISPNLRLLVVIPKFERIGRRGRKFPIWPGNVTHGRETFSRYRKTDRHHLRKRDRRGEPNDYLPPPISPDLSIQGSIPKFGRIGRHVRRTLPSGRKTLRMVARTGRGARFRKEFPDVRVFPPILGNAKYLATQMVLFRIPTYLRLRRRIPK